MSKAEREVTDYVGRFNRRFKENLEQVVREQLVPKLKSEFMRAYDALMNEESKQEAPAIRGDDPASLSAFRGIFEQQIDADLGKIVYSDTGIEINVGLKAALGFSHSRAERASDTPRDESPTTVDFLGYYVEGMIGEYAFITPAQYEMRRGHKGPLGRFGKGFLMSKRQYARERWAEVTGLSFAEVRHPISGQRPYKGFDYIAEKIDVGEYVTLALEKTTAETQ